MLKVSRQISKDMAKMDSMVTDDGAGLEDLPKLGQYEVETIDQP